MRFFFLFLVVFSSVLSQAQSFSSITESEVSRIEKTLSSDDMQGRKVYSPGIEKAAAFIRKEFSEAGLKPLSGSTDFNQSFSMVEPSQTEITATIDSQALNSSNVLVLAADSSISLNNDSHYKTIYVKKGDNFRGIFLQYLEADENTLIFVDTSFRRNFQNLAGYIAGVHMPQFVGGSNRIFVLVSGMPGFYDIKVKQNIKKQSLTNIVGIIPGKTKPDEYVIFSAHYDHLGVGKPNAAGDSVFNGANDDAAGTTAVISLAKYFGKHRDNQRTLVFACFTAEEVGEFGSAYFSKKLNPDKVVAMFNIEMIGTESKWGKNSAYITGFDKTDMGTILQKNLANTQFKFYPDPYPSENLFLRSDNATLAKKGVPAHTISTSKMDSEKYYHQLGDEISTLDMKNMTEIIRSIGMSASSIISGQDTPQRVKLD